MLHSKKVGQGFQFQFPLQSEDWIIWHILYCSAYSDPYSDPIIQNMNVWSTSTYIVLPPYRVQMYSDIVLVVLRTELFSGVYGESHHRTNLSIDLHAIITTQILTWDSSQIPQLTPLMEKESAHLLLHLAGTSLWLTRTSIIEA